MTEYSLCREGTHEVLISKIVSRKMEISPRKIPILCKVGCVQDAFIVGNTLAILEKAEKPKDERIKSGKFIKKK